MNSMIYSLLTFFTPQGAGSRSTSAPTTRHVTLPVNGWRSIRKPAGLSILCLRGRVTVTQEGDPRDVLLVAGEVYDVVRNGHLYVQAEREAELRFESVTVANRSFSDLGAPEPRSVLARRSP